MKKNLFIIFLIISSYTLGQSNMYNDLYNNILNNSYNVDYSYKRINAKSKTSNSNFFLEISYFINANTIQKNYSYNDNVINNIIQTGKQKNKTYKWVVTDVSNNSQNYSMKNKEFILYEGYLMRYIAEYMYYNPTNKLDDKDFVKKNFLKWYNKSVQQNGDASTLYGIRLHMGSHWATVANYLIKMDPENKKIYQEFVETYNNQLRKSLQIITIKGKEAYTWNSTYKDNFTAILKNRKKEFAVQDVSHGNHIIQYVIDSYKLGDKEWTQKDLIKFGNTLKYIIWIDKQKPSDNVDGSNSHSKSLKNTGWKQSDGWMKLMIELKDEEMYTIYDNFYKNNTSKINKFYPNLQYFSLMGNFQKQKQ